MFSILDKSYLVARPIGEIQKVAREQTLLIADPLFRELVTTKNDAQRAQCFQKLEAIQGQYRIGGGVVACLKHELENGTRADFSVTLGPQKAFFNPRLSKGELVFNDEFNQYLKEQFEGEISDMKIFSEGSPVVATWFPDLFNLNGTALEKKVSEYKIQVATDPTLVKRIYSGFRMAPWPEADLIGAGWTIFHWTQVRALWALDYVRRYGVTTPEKPVKAISSDIYDEEYCLLAILAGGLLTCDKVLHDNFELLRSCSA